MKRENDQDGTRQTQDATFKLRVVLDYVAHRRAKKRICKQNAITEQLPEQWYKEFLERAASIFAEPHAPVNPSHPSQGTTDSFIVKLDPRSLVSAPLLVR